MSESFEDKLKTRGLEWSINFLEKCGKEGHRLSTQFKLLLKTKSLIKTNETETETDLKSVNLSDYLENIIHHLQESSINQSSSHQTILDSLSANALLFKNSLNYFPDELEKIFIATDFPLWFTYLALQLLYKFEVQALRITGLVNFLNQLPPPEIQTCLRFQLAHAHLLLDKIDWATHYIDQIEAEVTFKHDNTLNTELLFLSTRRDFHQAKFESASKNLYTLLSQNNQTNKDIYLDLYIISLILSNPCKKRYEKIKQFNQIIKLKTSLPFYEILENFSNEEMILDLPNHPQCLTRRLIEKGVLLKSLRLHNLWVRSKSVESPLALIDLPITLGFKTSTSVAQDLLQELIDDKTIRVRIEGKMITFLDEKDVDQLGDKDLDPDHHRLNSNSLGSDSQLITSTQVDENENHQTSLIHRAFHPFRNLPSFPLIESQPHQSTSSLNLQNQLPNLNDIFPDHDEPLENFLPPTSNTSSPITYLNDHQSKPDQSNRNEKNQTINLISESENGSSGPALSTPRSEGRQKRRKSNPEPSTSNHPHHDKLETTFSDSSSSSSSGSSDVDYTPHTSTALPAFMSVKATKNKLHSKPRVSRSSRIQRIGITEDRFDYLVKVEFNPNYRPNNLPLLNQDELDKIVSVDYLKKNMELINDSLRHNSKGQTIHPNRFISRLKDHSSYPSLTSYAKEVIEGNFRKYLEFYTLRSTLSLPTSILKILIWFEVGNVFSFNTVRNYLHIFGLLTPILDQILWEDGHAIDLGLGVEELGRNETGVKDHSLWKDLVRVRKDQEMVY
ncbi:uncharacterized protein MELLADRAFT_112574 [Melampsora larici-populina 98AG31]|uniref:PCI domain-containing protein n=1 Tax=Melampsora larici-populina (strain 98AG31 / pathotype 3-4-7) TaxID=747676 RepID=F4S6X5_MELLP|nr:uncharacterized protein MELLADRAFT_112574 [Melampsora larici-populina 98AG31]EGF99533.1 hypothetical protein MELLADRAFT_112574 [Melampsora larici-populina 98AG31]